MQREREGRSRNNNSEMSDPFGIFRGFGSFDSHRSTMPSLFGRRIPFDDPFFSRPFGKTVEASSFGQSTFSMNKMQTNIPCGIVIEELPSDDDGDREECANAEVQKDGNSRSNQESSVDEQPDEDTREGKTCIVSHMNVDQNRVHPRVSSLSFSKVTYGGINGAYYTSTRTRRAGGDGVIVEESKEADRTTSEATHRISRGIHDKGHSVTRKLNSDGKVDTMQTLHNLNQDELTGFEEAWKGISNRQMPPRNNGFGNSGSGNGEPRSWRGLYTHNEGVPHNEFRPTTSGNSRKNVVRINIE